MENYGLNYKGGRLTEIVINALKPFIEKIKIFGIKKFVENILPGMNADKFILAKIKSQLSKRRGIDLGKGLGRVDIQYRYDGVQIEFVGVSRFLIKKITITDKRIIKSFDDILYQIEKKYIYDDSYIVQKIDDIVCSLSDTEIYKPETSEEKTLYDFATLILLNYYKSGQEIPLWIEPALVNIGKGEFTEKWIDIFVEYISEVIATVSEDIFFNFKVTFDSVLVRVLLNKKTNKGQFSKLLSLLNLNVKDIIYRFAKKYLSPSFIRGASEILSDIAGSFLSDSFKDSDINDSEDDLGIISLEPFNITVTLGEDVFSQRNFRWFTDSSINSGVLEYSYDSGFKDSVKVSALCERVPKAVPVLNLGLIASYKIIYLNKYSVSLDGLKYGRVYYRVVCEKNKISPIYHFKIKKSSNECRFMILADSQGMVKHDYDVFSNMLDCAVQREKNLDFMIHLGDFVDDGNNEQYWRWVLENDIWRQNPAVVLSGNHEARINAVVCKAGVENAVISHFNLKNLPVQKSALGVYYSFVYNNATFIVLNTNTNGEEELDKNQYNWALLTAKNSRTKWKILLTHKTPYSNGPHHKDSDVKKIGKQIVDLAYYGKIDLVIGGHDHVYARTKFLVEGMDVCSKSNVVKYKNEEYENFNNPLGTVFVTPSTSGVKNYTRHIPTDFPAFQLPDIHNPVYSQIEINGDSLYFNSYEFNDCCKSFKTVDKFALSKKNVKDMELDSSSVIDFIGAIPDMPWIDNTVRISKALLLYSALDYSEKIKVKNYCDLLNAYRMNESYKNIHTAEIRIVKNKREFKAALEDSSVGTIITECAEIRFENRLLMSDKIVINRDICITGEAKLSHVRFILKEKAFLILSGNVCIDNTRKPFSLYPAYNVFKMCDNSVLILNENATINGGYGIGFSGYGIYACGENTSVYLNSSGHNFVNKGLIFSSVKSSKIIVNSGKYLSCGECYTLNVNGTLKIKSGFIRSVKGYIESDLTISGGIIGEDDELSRLVPIETFGKVKITGGDIRDYDGVSVLVHNKMPDDIFVSSDSVDIKGRILYN